MRNAEVSILSYREASLFASGKGERRLRRVREYFEQVWVINLKRRRDRLAHFWREIEKAQWPFRRPQVFSAIAGNKVGVPKFWQTGGGSYGCIAFAPVNEHHRIVACCRVSVREADIFRLWLRHYAPHVDKIAAVLVVESGDDTTELEDLCRAQGVILGSWSATGFHPGCSIT